VKYRLGSKEIFHISFHIFHFSLKRGRLPLAFQMKNKMKNDKWKMVLIIG